jgi:predicted PhzF superfamily epimerase YddE/YHI9
MLAPYWLSVGHSRLADSASLLKSKTLRALQGGKDRQGQLEVQWDVESWRAKLRGNVVTVMEGKLRI